MGDPKWIKRWNTWIAPKPSKPGVWRRKEGGFVIRGRTLDPRTGKMREVREILPEANLDEAFERLQAETKQIRTAPQTLTVQSLPLFCTYAVSLLDRKMADGTLKARHSREVWDSTLRCHLIPAFGTYRVDQIHRADVLAWKDKIARRVNAEEVSRVTANNWLRLLALITNAAYDEFEIEGRNPMRKVPYFDTSEHPTYTEEEPNSLTNDELRIFLAMMRQKYPQHFAMTILGFALGLRPSSLRPLRRQGPTSDLRLDEGLLFVRRSHTGGQEVMNTTKVKLRQSIPLPPVVVDILRWHIGQLPEGAMRDSELLFPSITGGYRAVTVLLKPFEQISTAMKLTKHITPRAMRRTFQDLARTAEVRDLVTRAVSGHATEEMHRHYSTVQTQEIRDGLGRMVILGGFGEALGDGAGLGGMHGGMHLTQNDKDRSALTG